MPDNAAADSRLATVKAQLSRLGPDRVWRPVPGPDGTLLARGSGPDVAELAGYVRGLSFAGKSVIDLGCNLGFFSFLAARSGAKSVRGVDADAEVLAIAADLAGLHNLDNVRFQVGDFLKAPPAEAADLVLVIDFIGRGVIAKGRVDAVVGAAAGASRREIYFTATPVYNLADLPADPEAIVRRYGAFVRDDRFFLADYLDRRLGPGWVRQGLKQDGGLEGHKTGMLFSKRPAA